MCVLFAVLSCGKGRLRPPGADSLARHPPFFCALHGAPSHAQRVPSALYPPRRPGERRQCMLYMYRTAENVERAIGCGAACVCMCYKGWQNAQTAHRRHDCSRVSPAQHAGQVHTCRHGVWAVLSKSACMHSSSNTHVDHIRVSSPNICCGARSGHSSDLATAQTPPKHAGDNLTR